jgi:hypothetical protein
MESYRISREISDAVVHGEPLPGGPQDQKTLEAAMAVQGYTIAYTQVLERARRKDPIDAGLILDLYEALFGYALLSGGLPWVTLRRDERVPFFATIERAQVDDEASSFIQFMWHPIREAVRDIGTRAVPMRFMIS